MHCITGYSSPLYHKIGTGIVSSPIGSLVFVVQYSITESLHSVYPASYIQLFLSRSVSRSVYVDVGYVNALK